MTNVLLIVTDDQRVGSIEGFMPNLPTEIGDKGIRFQTACVAVPVCGPNRVSLLTGEYATSHGCYENQTSAQEFLTKRNSRHLGKWMNDAGYRTGMFGKWLNGYEDMPSSYVPPGWTTFAAIHNDAGYYDYDLVTNGFDIVHHGRQDSDYVVDVIADRAEEFIRETPDDEMLFAYVAFNAPHEPFIPAARHEGTFNDITPYRPLSYNEANVKDKPGYVQNVSIWGSADRIQRDNDRKDQLETLLSVDEGVMQLLTALLETGRLADTLIIYTSDNGFLWGEHRLWGKGVPYQSAHRVPLWMRWPGHITPGLRSVKPVSTIDIAPTVLRAAGVEVPASVEGLDLSPLFLTGTADIVRNRVFFSKREGGGVPAFCAGRNETQLFVRYDTGEEEFYRYDSDPHELESKPGLDAATTLRNGVKNWCEPEPPGMPEWG